MRFSNVLLINAYFLLFQVSKHLTHLGLKTQLHNQFFGGWCKWKDVQMVASATKKTCHVFSFTPLLRKTCPLSGVEWYNVKGRDRN